MKFEVTSEQMASIDNFTITKIGIPSLVLMERAALGVAEMAERIWGVKPGKVAIVCGAGNNGADGVAAGRILYLHQIDVTIFFAGILSKATTEMKQQLRIAKKLGMKILFKQDPDLSNYSIIVDALLGIGLTRNVDALYLPWIYEMNKKNHQVIAVDLPSGLSATTGEIMGSVVKADFTVTFGVMKKGLAMAHVKEYAGEIRVVDIGYPDSVVEKMIQTKP